MTESAPIGVTIAVRDNGNLKVTGPVTILDGAGNAFTVEVGKAVFLCRCGQSKTKPFCDSTHREVGFQSAVRVPVPPADPESATPGGAESA